MGYKAWWYIKVMPWICTFFQSLIDGLLNEDAERLEDERLENDVYIL